MLRSIYGLLPAATRHRLKSFVATTGHRASWLDSMKAWDHAASKKRCDVIAGQMAGKLSAAGIRSLVGKACLEFGAGYAPTELLVYHLLGAAPLWAVDYNPIARLGCLRRSLHRSDRQATLDALAGFADRATVGERFDRLLRLSTGAFDDFLRREMTYRAPFDSGRTPLPRAFDLINSTSVLEHVPPDALSRVVAGLADALAPGGVMIHHVDLKDHWDLYRDPLRFLSADEPFEPRRDADARGSGLRKSDYLAAFAPCIELDTRVVFEERVDPARLPVTLRSACRSYALDDLLGGEIVIVAVKRGAGPTAAAGSASP